jgi:uncharacterized protein
MLGVLALRRTLEILMVLSPIPAAMLLAWATATDAVALCGVPVGVLLAWRAMRLRHTTFADLGLRRPASPLRTFLIAVPATFILLVLTAVLGDLLQSLTGWAPDLERFEVLRGNLAALLAGLTMVWTTAAFGEELLFRGYLLNSLLDSWRQTRGLRWPMALGVSSAVFGLAHLYQGTGGVLLTAAVGLGFGVVYRMARRDLWAAILTHGLFDTASFAIVFLLTAAPLMHLFCGLAHLTECEQTYWNS